MHQAIEGFDRPAAAGGFLFYPTRLNDAPYFGAKRIVVSTGVTSTLDAPRITGVNGDSVVTWTSSEPLAEGFRLEARERDGTYREIAHVDRSARSATINVRPGSTIRIRAWSAAGMSPYSNELTIMPSKRRAVR